VRLFWYPSFMIGIEVVSHLYRFRKKRAETERHHFYDKKTMKNMKKKMNYVLLMIFSCC